MTLPFSLGVLSVAVPVFAQSGPAIKLKSRAFAPPANVRSVEARQQRQARADSRRAEGRARQRFLVQFEGPITASDIAELRAAGVHPLRYVPDFALAVSAPLDFEPSTLSRARWAGELTSSDRISPAAAAELARARLRFPLMFVQFHPDVSAAQAEAELHAVGTSAIARPGAPEYLALVPADKTVLRALAERDTVAWIYPAHGDEAASRAPVCQGVATPHGIVAEYATVGEGWDGPGRGSASLAFHLQASTPQVSSSATRAEIVRALGEWARHVQVSWRESSGPYESGALTIYWSTGEHGDGYPFAAETLAHAFHQSPVTPEPLAGDVHFNDAFQWGVNTTSRYDIFSVMLHEAGHSLGLGHSSDPADVMYATYSGIVAGLAPGDIATVRELYASTDPLPAGWTAAAIGPGVTAQASESDGVITLDASGQDVWGTADEFGFVSVPLRGDGDVIARVDAIGAVDRWTKAGVMIRNGSAAGAEHAFMLVSHERGLAFQRRRTANGSSYHTDGGAGTAPVWLWLSRRGSRFDAYAAADGGSWRLIGSDTITMPADVVAGLALTGHAGTAVARAAFSNVSVTAASAWSSADIGAVGRAGSTTAGGDRLTLRGAGVDIWDTADAFHFAWRPLDGDGEILARVASVQNTDRWAKAGVMIRASLDPGSPHALMLVSPGKGYAFQRRRTQGDISYHTAAGSGTAPQWVRLVRRGTTVTAYTSPDGSNWTLAGSDTIDLGARVLIGLAVSSHTTAALCEAVFEGVTIR